MPPRREYRFDDDDDDDDALEALERKHDEQPQRHQQAAAPLQQHQSRRSQPPPPPAQDPRRPHREYLPDDDAEDDDALDAHEHASLNPRGQHSAHSSHAQHHHAHVATIAPPAAAASSRPAEHSISLLPPRTNGGSSIASNGASFATSSAAAAPSSVSAAPDSHSHASAAAAAAAGLEVHDSDSAAYREEDDDDGVRYDDEEEEEEIEVDSDIESSIPKPAELEEDQPQYPSNWAVLWVLGTLACLALEFVILLPAFYLRLFVVGVLYATVWVGLAASAWGAGVCPRRRRRNSTLFLVLYVSALAAGVGGVVGASWYKRAWYFDRSSSAYANVNPQVDPDTGREWAGHSLTHRVVAEKFDVEPTFVSFQHDVAENITTYVSRTNPLNPLATQVGVHVFAGVTYCAAAIMSTASSSVLDNGSPSCAAGSCPTVFFWAVGEDCCGKPNDGSSRGVWTDCKYWGDNIPGVSRLLELGAEVLPDRQSDPYREAIADYMLQVFGEDPQRVYAPIDAPESYLVRVMTLDDHYAQQTERRTKAHIWLISAALLWPVLLALFLGAVWLSDKVAALLARKNPHRS